MKSERNSTDHVPAPNAANGHVGSGEEGRTFERRLAVVEQRFAAALAAARMVAWEWDPVRDRVVASATAGDVFGLRLGQTIQSSVQGFQLVHPDDLERHRATVQEAVRRGENYHSEFRIVRPIDGRLAWLEERGTATRDAAAGAVRMTGLVWDITERKLAEEARRESEERYRVLFNSIDQGFCVIEMLFDERGEPVDYRFVEVNAVFEQQTGLQEAVGKRMRELAPAHERHWFRIYGEVALSGRPARFEARAEALQRWYDVYAFRFGPPETARVAILFKDISERKRTEEALRESSERFSLISKITNDAVWDWDLATDNLWWNEGVEKLFGYDPATITPSVAWWRERIHPEDRERVLAGVYAVIDGGGREWSAEYRYHRADGGYAHVADRGFVVHDAAGRPIRMLGGMSDITARKQAEAALHEADRRKDEFLATLAHELRNPLAPIRQAANIAKAPHATEAQIRWSHDVIDRQVGHMALLLDDLLDVSRITRGKLTLRKQEVDLGAVIDAAVESARPLIEARRHALKIEPAPERLRLDADPLRLAQVFSNLLTNAAKYTEAGGTIRLSVERDDDTAVVRVADTGIGIPPDALPRMFEMFSQVQPAVDRAGGGLGIGLALSKGLVELHGGTIGVHSEGVGRGSAFSVRLPGVRAGALASAAPPAAAAHGPARRRKVLVVDDNRDAAESLAVFLALDGHDVRTAYDGLEALALGASFEPDCVLLDIGMPKLNGYEVARRLRRQDWGRKATLIATTGWGQREDREQALASGFDHHLTKPADPAVLQELINSSRGF